MPRRKKRNRGPVTTPHETLRYWWEEVAGVSEDDPVKTVRLAIKGVFRFSNGDQARIVKGVVRGDSERIAIVTQELLEEMREGYDFMGARRSDRGDCD